MSKNFEVLERSLKERMREEAGTSPSALAPATLVTPGLTRASSLPPRFRLPGDVAEEFIKLRQNLGASPRPIRLLAVGAVKPGEGATHVATQLAITFATGGQHRVLLVDASLRHPTVHRLFREPADPGLTELLDGSVGFMDAVRDTQIDGLAIVPAGAEPPAGPAQLFESSRFRKFLDFAREHYDVAIFDISPILPYAEGRMLAKSLDGLLLVLAANRTRRPEIAKARRQLESVDVPVLGAVLNRRQDFVPRFLYDRL